MILIDAVYINQSGGKNLLDLLIDNLDKESNEEILVLLDTRIQNNYETRLFKFVKLRFIKSGEIRRYLFYKKNLNTFRIVLCFANVPPPLKLNCVVHTYFHNVILLDKLIQNYFPLKARILFLLKRMVIRTRKNNTNFWMVQTQNVLQLLNHSLKIPVNKISILPFFAEINTNANTGRRFKENSFFYPATGDSHKNHERLLQVWKQLYEENNNLNELHLTVDKMRSNKLYNKIKLLQKAGVPVINHGYLTKTDVNKLYAKCRYVIHPSLGESFGLVLIESLKNNCILLAPNLPYVKAVVQPNYFFEPTDNLSIANTIKKALKREGALLPKILATDQIEDIVKIILD